MPVKPIASALAAVLLNVTTLTSLEASSASSPLTITARPISNFLIGSDQKEFGALTFIGGLEMVSRQSHFGAISGIEFKDGMAWLVTDTGFWINAKLERDEAGNPTAISAATFGEITGFDGTRYAEKWQVDAEGIAIDDDGQIVISFERDHRLSRYQWGNGQLAYVSEERPPVPLYELRQNRGFEGIAIAPAGFIHPRAIVGIAEKSLDKAGNIMGFVDPTGRDDAYEFSLLRTENYDVTDISFLPTGDLLVLERRFNLVQGISMRLRRVSGSALTERATVDGEMLLEADMSHQIDNMEGLSITPINDDQVRLTLVSDDNKSLLQRNLLLEFSLKLN
ncbi:MAG: esterase-like activity of phytase family protein [Pseudomonadota bacterium]